jgi:hypothetical protein
MQYERPARDFRAFLGGTFSARVKSARACAGLTLLEVMLEAPKSHLLELLKKQQPFEGCRLESKKRGFCNINGRYSVSKHF